jgi:hypothetical protein
LSTIRLTKPQTRVWKSRARFKIISAGRRFGKSYLALTWLVNNALTLGGLNYYIAPSYVMGKQIAWRLLKELFGDHIKTKNESELFVEFENGSIVQIKGADNRDSLRGVSLSSVCLDEASFMVQEVWTEVIRPATSDKQAPVLFISSPSGWNWFKELYDYASLGEDINWQAWTFTTADGGNVKPEEIEAAKRELPIKTFNQEYLASFETLSNRVYSNFDRMHNVAESDPDLNDFPDLYIGIDFNVNPMSAIVGVKSADQLFLLDEIILPNSNTTELSAEIKRRYPKHKIRVYPDPSGRARKTSAAGGITDFAILEQNGFSVIAPRAHPPVADRINEVQAMLQNANGQRRLFVSKKCKDMIKSLDGLVYKEKTGAPDKDSGLDHITDALGYLVHSEFPILKPISDVKIKFSW